MVANHRRSASSGGMVKLIACLGCLITGAAAEEAKVHGSFFAQYTGPSRQCGGSTPPGGTAWKMYGYDGLFVDIDTKSCNFTAGPQYVASIIGDKDHWQSTGTNTVLKSTAKSFRVIILHPSLRGSELLSAAQRYKWQISWVGDAGKNTGITVAGKTGWTQGKTKKTVVVDVTTSACGFTKAPKYFTTMRGFTNHWRVQGSHIVYFPKAKSFRTYIVYDNNITPKMAEGYKWQISWIGDTSKKSGSSKSDWKTDSSGNGLYIDVDTSSSGFSFRPSYVTAATTNYMHWNVNGGGSLYAPTSKSFRLYLNHAVKVSVARFYKWEVNYIGYDGPVNCAVGPWGHWGACTRLCDGSQFRQRKVIQQPQRNGTACPKLKEERKHCNLNSCTPQDCRVAPWTPWSNCSRTCGGGQSKRSREVVQQTKYKGKACPKLSDVRKCASTPCPVDCKVSKWSDWTPCQRRCGRSVQARTRKVLGKAAHGGKACPSVRKTKYCFGTKCIGEGPSVLCGGVSPAKTTWNMLSTDSVYTVVDTSLCNFSVVPEYVSTVVNADKSPYFSLFNGANTVVNSTLTTLTAVVWLPNLDGTQHLQTFAEHFGWRVNWMGDSGSHTGRTVAGRTKWKKVKGQNANLYTLYADVNTRGCNFPKSKAPQYFTTLHGLPGVERTKGSNIQFQATNKGFRVYIAASKIVTPAYAEQHMWTISWIGVPSTNFMQAFHATETPTMFSGAQTLNDVTGAGEGVWAYNNNDPHQGLYTSVDTHKVCALLASKYHRAPPLTVYVVSVAADTTDEWGNNFYNPDAYKANVGTMSINEVHNFHRTTKCGFNLHMGSGNITFPKKNRWRVQYLGFTVVDCIVSPWTQYTPCTKTCGGGTQFRTRKILQTPLRGGKACPPQSPGFYHQSRQCHMNDCVGKGKKQICGGTSGKGHTQWRMYGTKGLMLEMGTAFCRFQTATQYAVSIIGNRHHWLMQGSNAIAESSNARFRVITYPRTSASIQLLHSAKQYKWRLSWVGATGKNTGVTDPTATGWQQAKLGHGKKGVLLPNTLFADVDTSESGFANKDVYSTRPRLFTALTGFTNQWRTTGSHVVYAPTRKSFRVYVQYDKVITPAQAGKYKWQISWIGSSGKRTGSSGLEWKDTRNKVMKHNVKSHLPQGVYIDVDTTSKGFHVNPTYVTALETPKSDWHPMGAATMYQPSQSGFRVYLGTETIPRQMNSLVQNQFWDAALFAKDHKWTVNYLGYEGQSELCGATTGAGFTSWQKFGSLGLYLDVDTTDCDFKKTPQYLTTVDGVDQSPFFGFMKGTTVMASAAPTTFRVVIYYPALTGYNLVQYATKYKWHLSWLADSGSSGGCTVKGNTGWKQATVGWDGSANSAWTQKALYVDVDTAPWGFVQTPRYFTMLHGKKNHYKTQGSNLVYAPTSSGFRVYVVSNSKSITPAQAEKYHWSVSWMGTSSDSSGTSSSNWLPDKGGQGLYMKIDTSSNGFKIDPSYVVSVQTHSKQWIVNPLQSVDMSIDRSSYISFRVYLDMNNATFAKTNNWQVNYVGYEVINCEVSKWTQWGSCSATCDGGKQLRVRKILQQAVKGGRPCPSRLQQEKLCAQDSCDLCLTTAWSPWTKCNCQIGRRATQSRYRNDIGPVPGRQSNPQIATHKSSRKSSRLPSPVSRLVSRPGMKHCMIPSLKHTQPCYHSACLSHAPTPAPTHAKSTRKHVSAPVLTVPPVTRVKDLLELSLKMYGFTVTSFNARVQATFKSALAEVLGNNPKDIIITSITAGGARRLSQAEAMRHYITVKMSINQDSKSSATAMKFFVESSNFEQLLAAEFTQMGLKVQQGQLALSKPKIVPTAVQAQSTQAPVHQGSTKQYLVYLLGFVGLLYAVLGVKLLLDRQNASSGDYASEESTSLTQGGKSSTAPEGGQESLMMSDSNADPDVVIVDYGLDKF